jgi:hypothetical protein
MDAMNLVSRPRLIDGKKKRLVKAIILIARIGNWLHVVATASLRCDMTLPQILADFP